MSMTSLTADLEQVEDRGLRLRRVMMNGQVPRDERLEFERIEFREELSRFRLGRDSIRDYREILGQPSPAAGHLRR